MSTLHPWKKFTGVKPDVEHLRIFGCPVYIHVPKEKRSKMEPSGKKGIFVGYSETSKAYRIYIPGQRNIEVSRDVTFHEEVAFHRSREIPLDVELVEQEAPAAVGESSDKPPSPANKREESEEGPDVPTEEPIERLLEEIPAKRQTDSAGGRRSCCTEGNFSGK